MTPSPQPQSSVKPIEETKQPIIKIPQQITNDLQSREQDLMARARALEIEMESIKHAKLEQVMMQFEQ